MGTKSISQMDTKVIPHDTDLFEVAVVDTNSASGYSSGKMSAEVIADGMLNNYTYPTAMPNMQNRTITGALNTLLGNFAPVYDSTSTYAIGDVVTYNGALYKCNTTISVAEAWDSTHWDAGTCKDFFEGGGGISAVSKIWFGTISDYENLQAVDDDRIYICKERGLYETKNTYQVTKVYVGSTLIYPAVKTGYAFWLDNYVCPNNAKDYYPYYVVDTGINLNSSANCNRDFRIEFNASPASGVSGDIVVCGTAGASNQRKGIREVYFSNNQLWVYESSGGDTRASTIDARNKDVVIERIGSTMTVYIEGTQVYQFTCSNDTSPENLGIGSYSSSYAWAGTLNYFGIKWLS